MYSFLFAEEMTHWKNRALLQTQHGQHSYLPGGENSGVPL